MSTVIREPAWAREKREKARRVNALIDKVQAAGIWLGCWDCPEGKEPTYSRGEWATKAKHAGLITQEDEDFLWVQWHAIWLRDLSD